MFFKYLCLICIFVPCIFANNEKKPNFVIVGAGAAGIMTAKYMLLNGHEDVVILEAQDYYGGRIRSITDEEGQLIELGAARIEGATEDNTAHKLAKMFGLVPPSKAAEPNSNEKINIFTLANNDEKIQVTSDGKDFPLKELEPFIQIIHNSPNDLKNSTEILSTYFRRKFNEISNDQEQIGLALSYAQIYAETHSPASDWDQTNGISFTQQKKFDGGDYMLSGGMKTLLEGIMKKPNKRIEEKWDEIIKLNSEVTNIRYNDTKPVLTYINRLTKETHEIEAQIVVVTVSLGVLKEKYETLFYPELPPKMVTAINTINFGLENKIYLKFSEPWWPVDRKLHIFWTPEDKANLPEEDKWLPKIEVLVPYNKNTLMLYLMESKSYHQDYLTDEQVVGKIMPVIRKAFANKAWNITDPVKVYRSNWYKNPYIRGALTYPTAKSVEAGVKLSDLAERLKNPKGEEVVFFAGEGTNNDYYGSLHGALISAIE